jgi:SNF2 family DNA or RNA helicase
MTNTNTAVKVETKVGLLLSPEELSEDYLVLTSLHIIKSSKGIDFTLLDLNRSEIDKQYGPLSKQAKDILVQFSNDRIQSSEQEIKQRFANSKAGISKDTYIENALLRHLHQLFESLKPFCTLVKWYHKVKNADGKNSRTAPCVFSSYKPQLQFRVEKVNQHLILETDVVLNGACYNVNTFNRNHFLLESANEYFLLSYKDYQTLKWLETNSPFHYSLDATAFSQHILARLEADYTVNRNNHFNQKVIDVTPLNRVLLSELNNSFLMLTPQWLYDGIVVEGAWKEAQETIINGEVFVIKRNKEAEQNFVQLLVSLHANFSNQKNGYYYLSFAEAQKKQWFLKAYHKLLDLEIELVGMDMLQHFRYSQHRVEADVTIKSETQTRVVLQMKVSFGKEEIPLNVLQKTLLAGQRALVLKDGSLGVLSDEWLQQYSAIIKHGKIDKNQLEVARFLAISEQQTPNEQQVLKPLIKQTWWQKWKQWQNGNENLYTVPSTVNATLRPYQQKGFEWLALLAEAGAGGCLADDMGLGKTLQTISFLAHYIHQHADSINIIVCPSSLIYNWQQELQKFTPNITVAVYHGASRNVKELNDDKLNVIITSYGTIRADNEVLLTKTYGVAVIDESHNIKNPSAQITKVVSLIQANMRIALSGTPVVNNTFDLYAQLNFALPTMFGSREFFKREYADAIDRNRDEEKIKALQKLTAPFVLRRTKEQVAKDLPDKNEMILWCKMKPEQEALYNGIRDSIRGSIFLNIKNNGLNKSKLAVLQGMMKLRQVCNSPLLLPKEEQEGCKESVKTKVLIDELTNILGTHKALVFSQFSSMLDLLAEECDKLGIAYYHFDGQTPPAKRAEMVSEFQAEGNKTNLFLISLKAGNAGLTLTAADYVFLFDPWWNTAVEQQAVDRTHRIGQTKNVFAYKIICKNTIEEKIIQLQQRKKQLAEELISIDDDFVKTLSEEDIEYLLS